MEITNEEILESKFKKYKWKTVKKALYYFNDKYPDITDDEIKRFFNERKSVQYKKKLRKILMTRKFSATPKSYQMDIYFNSSKSDMYLLAVNINTKYAWMKKIKSKSTADVLPAIKQMCQELNPSIIESDEEGSFTDHRTVDFLRRSGIRQRVVIQSLHSDLGVLNRFCRTLNVLRKGKSVDEDKLMKLIKRYNKTYHSTINMTPQYMQTHPDEELAYIYRCFEERDEKDKLMMKKPLNVGDKVRYIRDDPDLFEKGRHKYELSKYWYFVDDVLSPYRVSIMAKDGTVKVLPRFRVYKLKPDSKLNYAPTIEDKSVMFTYKRIKQIYVDWYRSNGKNAVEGTMKLDKDTNLPKISYLVEMTVRDESGKEHTRDVEVSMKELRGENPTQLCELERKLLRRNHNYKYEPEAHIIIPAQGRYVKKSYGGIVRSYILLSDGDMWKGHIRK